MQLLRPVESYPPRGSERAPAQNDRKQDRALPLGRQRSSALRALATTRFPACRHVATGRESCVDPDCEV
jgi:hypothetical protein